jgi:phage gp45-like
MKMIGFLWGVLKESFFGDENEIRVTAEGRQDETINSKRLVQQHGHSSRPPVGSGLVFLRSGNSWVCLGSDSGLGPNLEEGESALYFDDNNFILMKKDGSIGIKSASVSMDIQELKITGKVTADGVIESKSGVKDPLGDMAEMRTIFNAHTHAVATAGSATAQTGTASPTTTPMN